MSRLKVIVALFSLTCVVLLFAFLHQRNRAKDLADQLDDAKTEVQLQLVVRQLAVPPEYLIVKEMGDWHTLDEARMRLFKDAGFPATDQYDNVLGHADLSRTPGQYLKPLPTTLPAGTDPDLSNRYSFLVMSDYGPGYAWYNEVCRACEVLTCFDPPVKGLNSDSSGTGIAFHNYIRRHPKLFALHIRPLLLRLSRAREAELAAAGCEALYANGDRSSELHGSLLSLIRVNHYSPYAFDAFPMLADLGDRSTAFRDAILLQLSFFGDPDHAQTRDYLRDLLHQCFPGTTAPAPATGPE